MNIEALDAALQEFVINLVGAGSPEQKGRGHQGDDQLRHDTKQFATQLGDFTRELTRQALDWARNVEKAGDRKLPGMFQDIRASVQSMIEMLEEKDRKLGEFQRRAEQMLRN